MRARTRISLGVLAAVATVAPASAQAQSDFAVPFASHKTGTVTAAAIKIVYRDPDDPNAKPSPIRHLVIKLPAGTFVGIKTVPACTASNEQLQLQGPSACPADSQVGAGKLTAITGFGAPFDPFVTKATLFNTGTGVLETIQEPMSGAVIAVDRISIEGTTMTGNPPMTPGGPPDGESAVREIDFEFPATTGFFKTPGDCPGSGKWVATAAFTFADGSVQNVSNSTPCDVPKAAPPPSTPANPPRRPPRRPTRCRRTRRSAHRSTASAAKKKRCRRRGRRHAVDPRFTG
jgi:hypothetical protein